MLARGAAARGAPLALDRPRTSRQPSRRVSKSLLRTAIARPRARSAGVADVQLFGERAHVRVEAGAPLADPGDGAALKQAGLDVESVRRVPASLEDVFIARIERKPHETPFRHVSSVRARERACAQGAVRLTLDEAIARGLEASHRVAKTARVKTPRAQLRNNAQAADLPVGGARRLHAHQPRAGVRGSRRRRRPA